MNMPTNCQHNVLWNTYKISIRIIKLVGQFDLHVSKLKATLTPNNMFDVFCLSEETYTALKAYGIFDQFIQDCFAGNRNLSRFQQTDTEWTDNSTSLIQQNWQKRCFFTLLLKMLNVLKMVDTVYHIQFMEKF